MEPGQIIKDKEGMLYIIIEIRANNVIAKLISLPIHRQIAGNPALFNVCKVRRLEFTNHYIATILDCDLPTITFHASSEKIEEIVSSDEEILCVSDETVEVYYVKFKFRRIGTRTLGIHLGTRIYTKSRG